MNDHEEVLALFRVEALEHLERASNCILSIESTQDAESVNALFRAFHTIKGNALMLGFARIGSLSHAAESVVSKVRAQTLLPTKQLVDLLFHVVDATELLLKDIEPDTLDDLIESLEAISDGTVSPQKIIQGKGEESLVAYTPPEPLAPAVPSTLREPSPPASGKPDNLSILIVEDDFVSRKIISGMLKEYGTCDIAKDGEEALVAFAQSLIEKSYDIIFLDIMLPKMDGFEVVRSIRTLEMQDAVQKFANEMRSVRMYNKKGAILVMTSSLDDPQNYLNACYRCGANMYLVKPVRKDDLDELISQYF